MSAMEKEPVEQYESELAASHEDAMRLVEG
jgi:hypothetical protein